VGSAKGKSASPAHRVRDFPVVALGASAGGLAAFEAFFSGMPAQLEPGLAIVIVQHLAPDHKSLLAELVRRYTRLKVSEVADGVAVAPNCAYVIPPGYDMVLRKGKFRLSRHTGEQGPRLPIDFFLRSLAEDRKDRAVAVILSGTGADGSLGLRAIKEEGGLILVQKPESAEFDGMPRSALATGLADHTLPPAEMPGVLLAFARSSVARRHGAAEQPERPEAALREIFALLRLRTGHDFSLYKPNTIDRRIERRMALQQVDGLEAYLSYLQRTPAEVESLFHELLINVTRFFRDPEVFAVVEETVVPKLLEGREPGSAVRIWVPGCSSGEEAYSLAILLAERMDSLQPGHAVQIFATDIDPRAIAAARSGIFPAAIAADIRPDRLARFFTPEAAGGYRVHKQIRDMVIFSEQDVAKDPPFSHLDLVSCRNLLIYLSSELQQKVLQIFHYALVPGGWLLLGNSESPGEASRTFSPVDAKAKLYQRLEGRATRGTPDAFASLLSAAAGLAKPSQPSIPARVKPPLRELAEREILQHSGLVGALVDARGDILYLHGRTGLYLEPTPGESGVSNILKMAREGSRAGLASALRRAASGREVTRCETMRIKTNSHYELVQVTVRPLASPAANSAPLFVVIWEATHEPVHDAPAPHAGRPDAPDDVSTLRRELRAKEEHLRTANEELQRSTEALQSSNEEMQSVNEELQSVNEELETSKEELQSVNEELSTVNAELQAKVTGLSRANNDMNNLLAGTGIDTVFVDHDLRILRFTPAASAIINLIQSDIGRPVAHIASNLVRYDRLVADTRHVLDTLVPKETEVQTADGKFYTLRIQPYRTLENVIEGAVISFIDITATVRVREDLRKANDLLRLAVVVRDTRDAVTVQDLEGVTIAWNPGAEALYGWAESEALGLPFRDRVPATSRKTEQARLRQVARGEIVPPYPAERSTKAGAVVPVRVTASALVDAEGKVYAVALTENLREGAA
jgi:two-component system CheB/CheR fusion protein